MLQGIGSLNSQDPSVGLVRGHCRSIKVPSGEMDAMVPCLEYAMLLRPGQRGVKSLHGPGWERTSIPTAATASHFIDSLLQLLAGGP